MRGIVFEVYWTKTHVLLLKKGGAGTVALMIIQKRDFDFNIFAAPMHL